MQYNGIFMKLLLIFSILNIISALKDQKKSNVKNCDLCKGNECRLCAYNLKTPSHVVKLKPKNGDLSAFLDENHKNARNGAYYFAIRGEGISGSLGNFSNLNNFEKIKLNHIRNSQYIGEVKIGNPGQKIYPIFDTGSTNFWAVGSDCSSKYCQNVHKFDSGLSKSFVKSKGSNKVYIKFGTGIIEGHIGNDTIAIGDLVVHNQSFGIIDREGEGIAGENPFKAIKFEGIVGLGFPDMSSIPGQPLFDNLIKQNVLNPEFSFYISNDNDKDSFLFFGGSDEKYYKGPVHMFPVVREHYWEVKLDALYIGDTKFCCDEQSYVVFDSGTSFNTIPSDEIGNFFAKVPEVDCSQIHTWPVITYVIHGIHIKLKPQQYSLATGNVCKPAFMQLDVPSEYGHAYVLGSYSFMRHYVTIYKRSIYQEQPSMVGVAKANHDV